MFNNFQRRRPGVKSARSSPTKGLLEEDGWKCNCDPRHPASILTVKKPGTTKGRRFYTCHKGKELGCNFFLWEEDARLREPKLGRTLDQQVSPSPMSRRPLRVFFQSASAAEKTPTKSRSVFAFPSPSRSKPSPSKRRREDSDSLYGVNPNDECVENGTDFLTPRKQRKTGGDAPAVTPSSVTEPGVRGQWERRSTAILSDSDSGKDRDDDIFTSPPTIKPTRRSLFIRERTPPPPLPTCQPSTPITSKLQFLTPTKLKQDIFGSPGCGMRDDLISDVFKLLAKNEVHLKGTDGELRSLLFRHLRQKEGIGQGRQVTRSALARAREEVARLRAQISTLEAEREETKVLHTSQIDELTNRLGDTILASQLSAKMRRGPRTPS